jgi:hypothetical protein
MARVRALAASFPHWDAMGLARAAVVTGCALTLIFAS